MMDILPQFLLITFTFLLAGTVKGVIGLGLPTVAMGLLGLVMPPAQAAALLLLPSLITNLWQLFTGPHFGALLQRLKGMMAGIGLGTLLGSGLMTGNHAGLATAALGIALVLYAVAGLASLRLRVPPAAEKWAGPLVGILTGVITGTTGVFVIPAVPYLNGLGLKRDSLIQALGLSFTLSTLALALGLLWHRALPLESIGWSLLALFPALLGMAFGGFLRAKVATETFRRCFFCGLLALGVEIAWQAV